MNMTQRICIKCSLEKSIELFPKRFNRKYNKYYNAHTCKKCERIRINENQKKRRSLETKEYKKELSNKGYMRIWSEGDIKGFWTQTKNRAKNRDLEFNLTLEDFIDIPTHCPILGWDIAIRHPNKMQNVSVDRIDNSKGYIKGNICFISLRANILKSNMSLKTMKNLYEFYNDLHFTK